MGSCCSKIEIFSYLLQASSDGDESEVGQLLGEEEEVQPVRPQPPIEPETDDLEIDSDHSRVAAGYR